MSYDLTTLAMMLEEKIRNIVMDKLANKGITDLTWHHGEIFKIIYESKTPITMIEIARKIGRSRSDITLLTGKMIKNGWIVKEPSLNDRRKIYLKLTQKSHNILPLFLNLSKEIQGRIELIMDPDKLVDLEKQLANIVNTL